MTSSTSTPDYSDYTVPVVKDAANLLASIAVKAQEQLRQEAHVAKLEEELGKEKAKLAFIAEVELLELMELAQQAELTTLQGIKVEVSETIHAAITDAHEAQAIAWLEENDHGELPKRQFIISFGKGDESWAKKFAADLSRRKRQVACEIKRKVHPSTLKAFVKEALGEGENLPLDIFGVHRKRLTKVSVK